MWERCFGKSAVKCEDDLTEMIAIYEQAELEKKLICYYVFSFHSMNQPLLAAGAALPGASVCDCHLDPGPSLLLCSKTMPLGPSATTVSEEAQPCCIIRRCASQLLSIMSAGAPPPPHAAAN